MVSGRSWLPTGLGHSGHVAVVRGIPQADPAEAELAEIRARPPATPAAVVAACLELRLAALPHSLRCLRHQSPCDCSESGWLPPPAPSDPGLSPASAPPSPSVPASSSPSSALTGFS